MNPFDRESRVARRLARLQKMADGFATSHMLPGNQDPAADRRRVPQQAISLVSDFLGQFIWPLPPQLVYRGIRTATRDEDTPAIEADAQIIISAKIVTASGCRVETEIPVMIRSGQLLEPSVMVVDGVPRIMAQSLVDEIIRPRTFKQKIDPRGGMFAPPLTVEERGFFLSMDEALKNQDRYNRGMFAVASKTAQSAQSDEPFDDEMPGLVEVLEQGEFDPGALTAEEIERFRGFIQRERPDLIGMFDAATQEFEQWSGEYVKGGRTINSFWGRRILRAQFREPGSDDQWCGVCGGGPVATVWADYGGAYLRGLPLCTDCYQMTQAKAAALAEWTGTKTAQAGRCNCESSKCDHERACPRPTGSHEVMYIGAVCDECYEKTPVEYRKAEEVLRRKTGRTARQTGRCPQCGGDKLDVTFPCKDCGFGGARKGRRAQRFDQGARVTVAGEPARVVEQVHEPTGNNAWDGTYRVEFLDGRTDVVPESKVSVDRDRETLRHVEGQGREFPYGVEETPTGRWQLVYLPDEQQGLYLHLDCDAYENKRSGKCEACGAESPMYGAGAGRRGQSKRRAEPNVSLEEFKRNLIIEPSSGEPCVSCGQLSTQTIAYGSWAPAAACDQHLDWLASSFMSSALGTGKHQAQGGDRISDVKCPYCGGDIAVCPQCDEDYPIGEDAGCLVDGVRLICGGCGKRLSQDGRGIMDDFRRIPLKQAQAGASCPKCGAPGYRPEGCSQCWYSDVAEVCARCESEWQPVEGPDGGKQCSVCGSGSHYPKLRSRMQAQAGASWPMLGEDVLQTATGRWQYIFDADERRARYYHLECDGYAGQDGDCELCGAPSPSSPRYETVGKGTYGPRSGAAVRRAWEPDEPKCQACDFTGLLDKQGRAFPSVGGDPRLLAAIEQEIQRHAQSEQVECPKCGKSYPIISPVTGQPNPSAPRPDQPGTRGWCSPCRAGGDRTSAREGDGQPAEHNETRKDDDFTAGQSVEFSKSFRNRTRGGPSYLIDSGTSGTVVRDVFEDGTSFEVEVDGKQVVVPRETLRKARRAQYEACPMCEGPLSVDQYGQVCPACQWHDDPEPFSPPGTYKVEGRRADRPGVDQLLHEIEAMLSEGYADLDVVLALKRKYPGVAHAAIAAARERELLDV